MAPFSSIIDRDYHFLQILIFIVVPFLYFIFKKFKTIPPPFPPGPTPWPIVGNLPQLIASGKKPHIAMTDLSKVHGPLMLLRLGAQKVVVVSSSAVAKEILTTHDRLLSARYVPKSVPTNQEECNKYSISMNNRCGDRWKYLRTLCRAELMTIKALDAQTCSRERIMVKMIDHIKAKNEGDVVKIRDLVYFTIFNIMSCILLSNDRVGYDENSDDGKAKHLMQKMLETFSVPNICDLYPILSKFDPQGIRKTLVMWRSTVAAIYEPIIEGRRKLGAFSSIQNDFLDVLLQNQFTNAGIFQFLLEMYSGTLSGPTITVEWAMVELIKSPESMKKVIHELENEVGIHIVKESHLVKLPYLQACIKETLRLHPPAPFLVPHRAPEACQVMNYTIPKNAIIYFNVWAMGRDPSIWSDPLVFKPERFLNNNVDFKGNDFEFIPFGAGRRLCPGIPLAGRILHLILATLLHSFDWTLAGGMSPQELEKSDKFGISLQIAQPLMVIPKSRK